MVGSAVWRALESKGYSNLIGKTSKELDLRNQQAVLAYFKKEQPIIVIDAAGKVGGILANSSFQYDFLLENLQIQNNLIDSSHQLGVKKFVFLGSSCIYPKIASQPIKEEYLLASTLEPSNKGYAMAKIAGVVACEAIRNQFNKDFLSLMPTNLYGYFDNFDLKTSHVFPAMIRKFHDAKINNNADVTLWGTGEPMREFLFVDDLADAIVHAMEKNLPEYLYNIGTGKDITLKMLAEKIQKVVGHKGDIIWDITKPDGTPRKLLDVTKIEQTGWKYSTELEKGIELTYNWFLDNLNNIREVKYINKLKSLK